jgi:hypothetical protein
MQSSIYVSILLSHQLFLKTGIFFIIIFFKLFATLSGYVLSFGMNYAFITS